MIDPARKKPSHKMPRLDLVKAPSLVLTRASLVPRAPPIRAVDRVATPVQPVATRETAKWALEQSAVLVQERVLMYRADLVWGTRLTVHSDKRLRRRKAP